MLDGQQNVKFVCVAGTYAMLNLIAKIYNSKIIQLKVCHPLQILVKILCLDPMALIPETSIF